MNKVSSASQDMMMRLVAWECFGGDVEPKDLLRQVPIRDLQTVSANIKDQGTQFKQFVCVQMVELELLFKSGLLQQDWSYERDGDKVTLTYEPVSYLPQQSEGELTDLSMDYLANMTPVGAMA